MCFRRCNLLFCSRVCRSPVQKLDTREGSTLRNQCRDLRQRKPQDIPLDSECLVSIVSKLLTSTVSALFLVIECVTRTCISIEQAN